MNDRCSRSQGVHTHIGHYHILQGVDLVVPARRTDDAAWPQWRRQDHDAAHHHGTVAASPGASFSTARDIAGLATPDIARAGIAYVPETMGIFADLTVHENMHAGGARRAASTTRGSTGSSASSRR